MNTAIVYGTSVAGLRAAANIGKLGYKVIILNKGRYLDDLPHQLSFNKPRTICNLCLRFVLKRMPNVEVIHNTEITSIEKSSNFKVKIKYRVPDIDEKKCVECNKCLDSGNVEVISRSMGGNVYIVKWDNVNNPEEFARICPFGAINIDHGEKEKVIEGDIFLVATNYTPEDKEKLRIFGYGISGDVVTIDEVENWFLGTGPELRTFVRPSDGKIPREVSYIVTQGFKNSSEIDSFEPFLRAIDNALSVKGIIPNANIKIFSKELYIWGKGQAGLLEKAKKHGIQFIITDNLTVENTAIKWDKNEFHSDIIILSPPQVAPIANKEISQKLGIPVDENGFIETKDIGSIFTGKEDILAIGEAIGHFTNIESLQDGAVAGTIAFEKLGRATRFKKSLPPIIEMDPYQETKIGVYLCRCALNDMNADKLEDAIYSLYGVSLVETIDFLCLNENVKKIYSDIKGEKVNRIIIAACSPWERGTFIQNTLRGMGIPSSVVDIAEIREFGTSPHDVENKEVIYDKVVDLVKLSVAKMQNAIPYEEPIEEIKPEIVVIGQDLSSLIATYYLGKYGFKTYFLMPKKIDDILISVKDISNYVERLKKEVKEIPEIHLFENTTIKAITGYAGNYSVDYTFEDKRQNVSVGALIIGGYAEQALPTGVELYSDNMLNINKLNFSNESNIAIICTGVIDGISYSRTSCPEGLRAALSLRKKGKDVTIFYSDSPGIGLYSRMKLSAKSVGVKFTHYASDSLKVEKDKSGIKVTYKDIKTNEIKEKSFEGFIVSPGIKNNQKYANDLSFILGLPIDENGFFLTRESPYEEINSKLSPNELGTNGLFITGLSKWQNDTTGLIIDGMASAFDALSIVTKQQLIPQYGWVIAWTDERKCAGCGFCVDACGYNVRYIDPETKVAKVRPLICQGCGACEVACPSGAAKLRVLNAKTVIQMMDSII